jgi:choline dehydrogenase-like flavoprotein
MLEGISLPPGPLLSALPGAGEHFKELTARRRQIATFGIMVSDTGVGRVYKGIGDLAFTAVYQLSQADAESLRFGMARLGELYFAAGAKTLYTNALPFPVIRSMDDLRAFEASRIKPGGLEVMAFHPTGTCSMSLRREDGVVNADLRTHDMPNLYIMDGSVIPVALGVNPQITIMALARHGAAQLAASLTRH